MDAGHGIHVLYEGRGEPHGRVQASVGQATVQPISWRPRANKDNDYLIDRQAQKEKRAYSGVFGISEQDASLQESMGAIQDRTQEKLLSTDKGIVMARRMLEEAARALEKGQEPPALQAATQSVRAAGVLLSVGQNPVVWAKDKIENVAGKPIFSV